MKLHFGPYRSRHLHDCPRDYLIRLLSWDFLSLRLREAIENVLAPDNAFCLGPRWWHLRRGLRV
jgi:hypothetical protein